jgi:hypothetical protein
VTVPVDIRLIVVSADDLTLGLGTHSLAEAADGAVSLAVMAVLDGLLLALSVIKFSRALRRLAGHLHQRTAHRAVAGAP